MAGRFAIRSGTHSVPLGGGLDGLTQWEVTIAELLSGTGYATGHFGKRLFLHMYGKIIASALYHALVWQNIRRLLQGTPDPYEPLKTR
jgi:hypothetical protein